MEKINLCAGGLQGKTMEVGETKAKRESRNLKVSQWRVKGERK